MCTRFSFGARPLYGSTHGFVRIPFAILAPGTRSCRVEFPTWRWGRPEWTAARDRRIRAARAGSGDRDASKKLPRPQEPGTDRLHILAGVGTLYP